MAWEAKDYIAVSGGLLGFLSFILTAFRSIAASNKAKWLAIDEIIHEAALHSTWSHFKRSGTLDGSLLEAIKELSTRMADKGETFLFKSVFGHPYERDLNQLRTLTEIIPQKLSTGHWRSFISPLGGTRQYTLDETFFEVEHGRSGSREAYGKYQIEFAANVEDALAAIERIRRRANRDDYEYLLPWRR